MSSLMSWFRTLTIQLVIFLGLLLLVEQVMGLWFPFNENQQGAHKFHQNLKGLKSEITYSSDRFGLRSLQPIAQEKPEEQIRILCLGASTTEQTTQETADTWCGILDIELKKKLPEYAGRLQTVAFGAGGHRAVDSALWLREHIDLIKPDVIVTLLGINDLTWNGGADYQYQNIEVKLAQVAENKKSFTSQLCKGYSQVCKRLSKIKRYIKTQIALNSGRLIEWHSSNLPKLQEKLRNYPKAQTVTRKQDPFYEFKDASSWIANYLKQKKIKLIMLGQPVLWKANMSQKAIDQLWFPVNTENGYVRADGEWLHQENRRYSYAQKQIAMNNEAYYMDLDVLIPKNTDYYFDDCHFTDIGSKKVAMNILPILIKALENI